MPDDRVMIELVGGPRDGDRLDVAPPPPPDLAVAPLRETRHESVYDALTGEVMGMVGLSLVIYRRGLAAPRDGVHLYHYDEDVSD